MPVPKKNKAKPTVANKGAMKNVLAAKKTDTIILGQIHTYMMAAAAEDDGSRDSSRLHPSEICKSQWCPRSSFFAISPKYPDVKVNDPNYVLENIYDEGHAIHTKWQRRLWEMGILRGTFSCLKCGGRFHATAPLACAECGAPKRFLHYAEISLANEEHMLVGHTDGDLHIGDDPALDPLLEIKSIGIGTVRVEYPSLLFSHTHRVTLEDGTERTMIDYDRLWADIKRPFPSHIRQGALYCFMHGRTSIVFLYECKWNQQVKEFRIVYKRQFIEAILDGALDVKYGLKTGRPPAMPGWAKKDEKPCSSCGYKNLCYESENNNGLDDEGSDASGEDRGSAAAPGEGAGGPPSPDAAELRPAEGAGQGVRVVRRRADAALRGADSVD